MRAKNVKPDKTIFFPAKYEKYSEIIRIDTPEAAKDSVKKMLEEFNKAETRDKKIRLKKMVVLAANRAKVMSQNKRISEAQRLEAAKVERIYRNAAKKMIIPPKQ